MTELDLDSPAGRSQVAGALARCHLFEGLALQEDLAHCCPTATRVALRDKDALYSQGEACSHVFCVLEGQVKLSCVSREGAAFTTAFLSAGELFGPALSGSPQAVAQEAATARDATLLWRASGAEFQALLLRQPQLGLRLVALLARRQQRLERRLACLALKRTEARLAETLRELSGAFEVRCEHGFGQHLRITQQELADLVGASRPVVSAILKRLRDQGVLGYSREYLCVRGLAAIERLIGE